MKKLLIVVLAVSALCAVLAGPSLADEAKTDEAKKVEVKKAEVKKAAIPAGQKVFTEAKCQMCHTVYSAGIGEPPAEDAKKEEEEEAAAGPPDLSMAGAGRTAEWISLFLQKKEALNDKKHVKSFEGSDEDLAALAGWLLTLKPAEEDAPKAEKATDAGVEKAAEPEAPAKPDESEKAEGEAAEKGTGCEDHDHGDKADEDADTEAKEGE